MLNHLSQSSDAKPHRILERTIKRRIALGWLAGVEMALLARFQARTQHLIPS